MLESDEEGDTPLHIAARNGDLPAVEQILKEKPSLAGALNNDDNTPLHEAAKWGHANVVGIFLRQRKSFADQHNKFGETALIIASMYGHLDTVKLLLKAGSNENILRLGLSFFFHSLVPESEYLGAASHLHAAVYGGHPEIVEAILCTAGSWNKYLITAKDKFGRCPVHIAAMKGNLEILELFARSRANYVEIRSSDHKSVVHFAVEYNQFEMLRSLLPYREEVKVGQLLSRDHDCFHNTVFHLAAKNAVDPQLVKYLVSFPGVDVNAVNDEDMTALGIASAAANDNPDSAIIAHILEGAGAVRWSLIPRSISTRGSNQENTINTHMVVASLIATVTFAAIFQIPGGIENDRQSIHYGAAKLAFSKLFRLFIFSNTVAFTTSIAVVVAWLVQQRWTGTHPGLIVRFIHRTLPSLSTVNLLISIFWMAVAFLSALIIVTIPHNFEKLENKHKHAFSRYKLLLVYEVLLTTITTYLVVNTLFIVFNLVVGTNHRFPTSLFILFCQMLYFTLFILLFSFT